MEYETPPGMTSVWFGKGDKVYAYIDHGGVLYVDDNAFWTLLSDVLNLKDKRHIILKIIHTYFRKNCGFDFKWLEFKNLEVYQFGNI